MIINSAVKVKEKLLLEKQEIAEKLKVIIVYIHSI